MLHSHTEAPKSLHIGLHEAIYVLEGKPFCFLLQISNCGSKHWICCEPRGTWWAGPLSWGPKPLGSPGLQFRFRLVIVLCGFNLCTPVFLSLSCALIMTSKFKYAFFKSEKVNKFKPVLGV